MTRYLVFCVILALSFLSQPDAAHAQAPAACVQPGTITRDALGTRDLATVQLGLRTALGLRDFGLDDGDLGPVTRNALRDLCLAYDFINADPANDVAETLDLAEEYGKLARAVPTWSSDLATLENLMIPGAARLDLRVLRLAGPPALTAGVLAEGGTAVCETIDVGGVAEAARPALDALLRTRDTATLCADLVVADPEITVTEVLSGLSGLQDEFDAIEILQSTEFVTWLAQDLQPRLIQLAGSNAAVIDLLDRFEIERPRVRTTIAPTPPSCAVKPDTTTVRFFSFGEKELEILGNTIDVSTLLAPLAEAEGARSPERLWAQMEPLLVDDLDQCALDRIEGLVLGPDRLGLGYQLDADRVADFKLSPDLIDSEPILAPLIDLRVASDADLLAGLRVNLTRALTESLNGQIEVAAELLAGAAEEVQESLDVARVDPENFDTVELPPLLGITDPSVKAALDTITNEAFKRAIFEGPFIVGTNDEILKAEVRNLLRPLIADQVAQAVNRDVALIASAIRSDWRVTPTMIARINALSEVARVSGDAKGARLEERMQKLIGLSYPNENLFRAALRDVEKVTPTTPGNPLSTTLEDRAVELAQTVIDDPFGDRVTAQLAIEDCGCVAPKSRADANEVYGFYPFWYAPLVDAPADDATTGAATDAAIDTGADEQAAEAQTPKRPERIDYSFMSRVAFYGMEFDFDFPNETGDRRNLQLNFLNHWITMQRDFITSAHQHRAKVDVAFDMRAWRDLTVNQESYLVDRIIEYTAPIPRLAEPTFKAFWAALPTLFDSMQPDGVTLIFEDFSGIPYTDEDVATLVRLVQEIEQELSKRGQVVNLAFNLSIVDVDEQTGLMDDLRELLLPAGDGEKTVDRVLFFLERPTTLTKKLTRHRLDFGEFRGAERETVLNNLVPILPASAHENVLQRPRKNVEEDSEGKPFSQFEDDIIYFTEDFAGVGFWPIPVQGAPETETLKEITLAQWQVQLLPSELSAFEAQYDEFCTWACPRRAAIALVTMAVFGVTTVLVALSYYSGTIDKVAFKWYLVHLGVFFVLAALLVLTTCDPAATAPPILLFTAVLGLLFLFAADFVQRMRNGPKP